MAVSAERSGCGRARAGAQRAAVDAMTTATLCHIKRVCRCCACQLATAGRGEKPSIGGGQRELGSRAICGARTRRALRL